MGSFALQLILVNLLGAVVMVSRSLVFRERLRSVQLELGERFDPGMLGECERWKSSLELRKIT